MGLRKILTYKDPALHKVCRPVEKFDWRLHKLLNDMTDTLAEANGVGLAAPQVGILRRVVIVDTGVELVNPELVETSGEQCGAEGCLSVPGKYGLVKRPNYAKVRAQDRNGEWFEAEGEELIARCFCHELDHLDGIVYTEVMERFLTEEELELAGWTRKEADLLAQWCFLGSELTEESFQRLAGALESQSKTGLTARLQSAWQKVTALPELDPVAWRSVLALGGALGNLYDRVVLGYVIDMMDFCLIHFAVFNVADACVNIGIVLLAIWMVFFEEKDKQHAVYRWGAPKAAAQTEGGNHDPSDSKEKNEDADTAPDCR